MATGGAGQMRIQANIDRAFHLTGRLCQAFCTCLLPVMILDVSL